MPTYTPIDAGVSFHPDAISLRDVRWSLNGLLVKWRLPSDQVLFVRFSTQTIVRIMDEFPFLDELTGVTRSQLLLGFAFEVKEGALLGSVPKLFGEQTKHYQFLTGAACMDVVTMRPPRFKVMAEKS